MSRRRTADARAQCALTSVLPWQRPHLLLETILSNARGPGVGLMGSYMKLQAEGAQGPCC